MTVRDSEICLRARDVFVMSRVARTVRSDPLVGVVDARLLIALSAYSLTGSRASKDTVIRSRSIVSQRAETGSLSSRAVQPARSHVCLGDFLLDYR